MRRFILDKILWHWLSLDDQKLINIINEIKFKKLGVKEIPIYIELWPVGD